jgi:hypothetical protein
MACSLLQISGTNKLHIKLGKSAKALRLLHRLEKV